MHDIEIIAEKQKESHFQLAFQLENTTAECLLEYKLPFPNIVQTFNGFIRVLWLINGYVGTESTRNFLNDVIARFIVSFADFKTERINFKLKTKNKNTTELKAFGNLKSLNGKALYTPKRADSSTFAQDQVFYAIKFFAEQLIKQYGFCQYSRLEDYATQNFLDKKGYSTLKAKCKSIWAYYDEKDYKLDKYQRKTTDLEWQMTRQENMKKVTQDKTDKKMKMVQNAITGINKDTYKKKNGLFNATKIARELKLSQTTVLKYLNELNINLTLKSEAHVPI